MLSSEPDTPEPGIPKASTKANSPTAAQDKGEPLRLGLLLESLEVRAWVYEMIEQVLDDGHANIELIIVSNAETSSETKHPQRSSFSVNRLFGALTRRVADGINTYYVQRDRSIESATVSRTITDLLPDTKIIEVDTDVTANSEEFSESALETIRDHDLDVLYRGGFKILKGGILTAARHGVWSHHHGDNRINRGGPPGFWEVMESWPSIGSVLQILGTELDNGQVLYRSSGPVAAYSLHNTRHRNYWKSAVFLPRVLQELYEYPDTFYQRVAARQATETFYSQRIYRNPTPTQYLLLTLHKTIAKVRLSLRKRLTREQWILLFNLRNSDSGEGPEKTMYRYRELTPPSDRIWADPHVIHRDDRFYVFFEEMIIETNKGHLCVIEIDAAGNVSKAQKILEKPYHLSYPSIIETDNELWMIPESVSNNSVDLYRCIDFPLRWEHHRTLFENARMVDSTVCFHEGRWWLFANIESHRSMAGHGWDELHIFHTDDFVSGQWQAHPMNPVISDVTCSRPAGPLYTENGKLFRPSQNCSFDYGYGFNISEIVTLTTDDYAETVIERITPHWRPDIIATHSIAHADNGSTILSVIDAHKVTSKFHRNR